MIPKEKLTQKLSIWGLISWPLKKKGRKSLHLGLPPASQAGAKKRRRPQLPPIFFSGKRANAPCSRWRTGNMELYQSCTTVVFAGKQKLFLKKSLFLIGPLLLAAEMCENGYLHFLPPLKRPFVSFPSREFVFKLLLLILPAQKLVVGLYKRFPPVTPGGQFFFSLSLQKPGPFIFRDSCKMDRQTS